MKKLKLCSFFTLIAFQLFSQNYIQLSDKSRIRIDSIYDISSKLVTYVANSTLHDVAIETISYIRMGDTLLITFDPENQPVYAVPKKEPAIPANKNSAILIRPEKTQKVVMPVSPGRDSIWRNEINFVFFPLTLIEPDMGIRAGLEFGLSRFASLQADFTYLFDSWGNDFDFDPSPVIFYEGFAGRVEFRVYSRAPHKNRSYFALQGMAKYKRTGGTGYQMQETKTVNGMNLKLGTVSNKERRLYLDAYAGFGLRFESGNSPTSFSATYPGLMLGFSIGARINR